MNRVTVRPKDAQDDTLLLVNDRHPLTRWPAPESLAAVGQSGVLLRRDAAAQLAALLAALGAEEAIVPVSGFRAHAEQQALYADCLRTHGASFTERFVALPGCSEHETGLAIDLGERRDEIDFLRPAFPDTGLCGAFRKSAARFGFIERYPAGARSVTHIDAEPWHFRYIGAPHAAWLTDAGLTLEEYVGRLAGYSPAAPLRRAGCTVFTVPEGAAFSVPESARWTASADNCGRTVVTVWGAP